ncbi:MAG: hypothetical protein AB1744_13890 [Candidatus Zixiibacteriota bacterium]
MKLNYAVFVSLAIVAIVAASCRNEVDESNLRPVTWAEVRAEIADYIGIVVDTFPDGGTAYWLKHGADNKCVDEPTTTRLERAVKTTLEKAKPLLIGIQPDYVGFTYDSTVPIEELNKRLQEAYLSSDIFLRPILSRLTDVLARQRLACHDLPVLEQRPLRSIAWKEFAPYLTAYAWPDEVRPLQDENGNPTGKRRYTFHICLDGASPKLVEM